MKNRNRLVATAAITLAGGAIVAGAFITSTAMASAPTPDAAIVKVVVPDGVVGSAIFCSFAVPADLEGALTIASPATPSDPSVVFSASASDAPMSPGDVASVVAGGVVVPGDLVRTDANAVTVDGDGTVSIDPSQAPIAVLLPLDQANVREGSATECAALTTAVGPAAATTPASAP